MKVTDKHGSGMLMCLQNKAETLYHGSKDNGTRLKELFAQLNDSKYVAFTDDYTL